MNYARCRACGSVVLLSDAILELSDGPPCPACGSETLTYFDGTTPDGD